MKITGADAPQIKQVMAKKVSVEVEGMSIRDELVYGRGMRLFKYLSLLFVVGLLVGQNPLHARFVRDWSFEDLVKASDLVVIAEPITNSNNSDQDEASPKDVQGVSTTFKTLGCLKGTPGKDTVVVKHFIEKSKTRSNAGGLINFLIGPISLKVTFQRKGEAGEQSSEILKPKWLLFLAAGPDGSYRPVSGQHDPEYSFHEIHDASMFATVAYGDGDQ